MRYVSAGALVAAGLLARFILQPVFGAAHVYTVFYPVVLIAAYALGPRPATLAAMLSGALAYWCFVPPAFQWKWDTAAALALTFFAATSLLAIYLTGALARALEGLAARKARAEATANEQAGLFGESPNRVAHHQQLISGLLALQVRSECDTPLSISQQPTPGRSVDMALIHREFAGQADEPVDVHAFACALARTSPVQMDVIGEGLVLPRGQATSLGVALLECLSALSSRKVEGQIRVTVSADAARARLRMSEMDGVTGLGAASLADAFQLRAMMDQLGGRLRVSADRDGSAIELSFPRTFAGSDARPAAERAQATLH